jgi:hypothetical protein
MRSPPRERIRSSGFRQIAVAGFAADACRLFGFVETRDVAAAWLHAAR